MLFWVTFLLVSACDYLSKDWIRQNFALGESRKILGSFLRFTHWSNTGASFESCRAAHIWPLSVWAVCSCRSSSIPAQEKRVLGVVSMGLIAGGRLGTSWTGCVSGSVTDFISLSFFPPVFNVADCAIVIGAVLMTVFFLLNPEGRFEE